MRKLFFLVIIFTVLLLFSFDTNAQTVSPSQAVSPTKTATPSSALDNSIKMFTDKLATKVAELSKEKKIITGIISKIDKNSINVTGLDGKKYSVTTDETITDVFSVALGKKQMKLADLTKDMYLILSGTVIDNTITANTIYVDDQYMVASGKITDVDAVASTIRVVTTDKDDITLTVETKKTKLQLIDSKSLLLLATTFTKIKEGDTIHFVAKKPADGKIEKLNADRILILPQEYFVKS
jgi:hypothetical protein